MAQSELRSSAFYKALLAEFLGTLFLVYVGCGSCTGEKPNITAIALTFGLSVATIVWSIAHVSGGHINPAVTLAMTVTRKISIVRGIFYIIAQLLGSLTGAGILYGLTPENTRGGFGVTGLTHVNSGQGFGIEFLVTFVLVFTVFATCDAQRKDAHGSGPLAIGLSVTMCHLYAVQYTGSSMNTARSFGPAAVFDKWDDHWVYWIGPLLGGACAGIIYDMIFAVNADTSKLRMCLTNKAYNSATYGVEEEAAAPEELHRFK